jgi:hypothetical protein
LNIVFPGATHFGKCIAPTNGPGSLLPGLFYTSKFDQYKELI